eukprot:m.22966 g.22966  ORF g.22966 m.22966 type:complete len:228 (+) comp11312_c0_seq1:32-715(+)
MQVAVLFVCVASWLSAVGGEDVCAKTDFHHGNFRCKCTCPVDTEPLEDGSKETGCTATSQNYDAGVRRSRCGKEMCLTCVNDEQTKRERQCTYSIVTNSEDQCLCQNVMPTTAGRNYTDATAADCDLCTCTYEARNTDLIKAAVIIFLVAVVVLLTIALLNTLTSSDSTSLSINADAGLDVGDDDEGDEAYLLEASSGSRSSRLSGSVSKRMPAKLRRDAFENEIGW